MAIEEVDVAIVGAGPAGASTAIGLKHTPLRVAVFDKAKFPRDKICGDALSIKISEAMRQLSPDLLEKFEHFTEKVCTNAVKIVSPSNDCLEIVFKPKKHFSGSTIGYVSRRVDFDNFLVEQFRNAPNITFYENTPIDEVEVHREYVELQARGRIIRTKIAVAADGAHSLLAKRLANFKLDEQHYSAAVRAYIKGIADTRPENYVEFYLLRDLRPGYLWIFPLPNGLANVGLGMLSAALHKKRINLRQKLLEILRTHPQLASRFQHAEIVGDIKGFGLPLGSKRFHISGERFLLTGDAASLIDPLTGEGIGEAMLSGTFAAKHILNCFKAQDFSAAFNKQYDEMVYGRLMPSFRLHSVLQKVAATPFLVNLLVRKVGRSEYLKDTVAGMVENFELRKRLGQPSFYLRLLFE
ncbi:MAG: NAD(P)/FAD-dependent oxidoreductase [Candidatus Thermochlorobacter sp.]